MTVLSVLGGAWNTLGDTAAMIFSWGAYILVRLWLWRLPGVPEEGIILMYFAIPSTIGFIVEHGGPFLTQGLAVKHIGIPGANGAVVPFTVPPITNVVVWVIWDILLYIFANYFVPILIIGGVVLLFLIIKSRRAHP